MFQLYYWQEHEAFSWQCQWNYLLDHVYLCTIIITIVEFEEHEIKQPCTVRGCHVYKAMWLPMDYCTKHQYNNPHNKYITAVLPVIL